MSKLSNTYRLGVKELWSLIARQQVHCSDFLVSALELAACKTH